MTIQLPPVPAMTVQVVPAGIGVLPPDQFGSCFVPGSLVELKTAGVTGMKLTALKAVATVPVPVMFASGGSSTVSLIIVALLKVVEVPGETGCCGVVKVAASETDCGLSLALSVIVSVPGSEPGTVRVNVTVMMQLACGARVAGGIGHVFVCV
jgi:hypothetical protein